MNILIFSMLFAFISFTAAEVVEPPQYRYLEDFRTEKLHDQGNALRTSGSIISNLDPVMTCRLLQSDQYYDSWVIPGLNAKNERLHPPIAVHNSLLASECGNELLLNFSLVSPIDISGITIPFNFTANSIDDDHILVNISLKKKNIAVKDAIVEIEIFRCERGTIINASVTVDFSFLVDLFLNSEKYAENTEERMRLLIKNFIILTAGEIARTNE